MRRLCVILVSLLVLSACNGAWDLDEPAVPLGDFNLVHNIAVASKAQKGPFSREATEEQLTEALAAATAERFDRYEGARNYHFGMSVEGYVLAQPGIPVVATPKSIMIVNLTVWDDALNKKLNEKPHQITVFESFDQGACRGLGLLPRRPRSSSRTCRRTWPSRSRAIWCVRTAKRAGSRGSRKRPKWLPKRNDATRLGNCQEPLDFTSQVQYIARHIARRALSFAQG